MTKERLAKLAESFLADYADPEINARMFFDWWSDRHRLAESAAERLWKAVAAVLYQRRPVTATLRGRPVGRPPRLA